MSAKVIDGKAVAAALREELAKEVAAITPSSLASAPMRTPNDRIPISSHWRCLEPT